jgi:hypothetical protein
VPFNTPSFFKAISKCVCEGYDNTLEKLLSDGISTTKLGRSCPLDHIPLKFVGGYKKSSISAART